MNTEKIYRVLTRYAFRRSFKSIHLVERAQKLWKEQSVLDKGGTFIFGAYSGFSAWNEHDNRNWKWNMWSPERKAVSHAREFFFGGIFTFCATAYFQPIANGELWRKIR